MAAFKPSAVFVFGWWATLVALFCFFPGHECRGAALGFYVGVLPADIIIRKVLGSYSALSVLVVGVLIASIPVLWSGWIWSRHAVGVPAKSVLIVGSFVMGVAGFLHRYWHYDSFVSYLSNVVPEDYEITRWDHIRLVLLPLGLAAACWWTTLWSVLVAIVVLRRSRSAHAASGTT